MNKTKRATAKGKSANGGLDGLRKLRMEIRAGKFNQTTAGQAPGFVQGNVTILPADWAADFMRYCFLNPQPCPLVAMGNPGDPFLPQLGEGIDIRSDVPEYRVFQDGSEVDVVTDIRHLWRDDLVTFVMGCSFSFEEALIQSGLPIRHLENQAVNPMYTSNIQTKPAGAFHGELVVSMRPFNVAGAIRAIQITSRFPNVHGAPIHFGDPRKIGIADLNATEFGGEPVAIYEDEIPVFWACGVTPQVAVSYARPPFCITHKPGKLLITERLNAEMAAF